MAPKSPKEVYNISSKLNRNENPGKIFQLFIFRILLIFVFEADFETAISATKFGKFNIFLFLLSIPAGWTNMFETTTMSYVFPAAHCDLDLSLNQRGSLNAITFIGKFFKSCIIIDQNCQVWFRAASFGAFFATLQAVKN